MTNLVSIRFVSGTSTERGNIPASTAIGIEFWETDTGAAYYSDGSSWLKKITSGAVNIRQIASDVPFPPQQVPPWSGLAGAADNAVIYTSVDVSGYNYHTIENRSGNSVDVQVTTDGTFNASQPSAAVLLTDDVTTGGGVLVLAIPTNKTGVLRGKFKNIQVSQVGAGTITAGTVVGAHGVE